MTGSGWYLLFKAAHILAVIAFLGNILTGVFWHLHAEHTRDPKLIAHVMRGIIASDRVFTIPGVIGIILFGFGGAIVGRLPILSTDWILGTIVLFSISGVIFMARLVPLQRRMRDLADAGARAAAFDFEGYRRVARSWQIWGTIALVLPLIGAVLMVLKPNR